MNFHNFNKRVLLVILDGFGINPKDNKNAILHAKKPNIDSLFAHYPMTTIEAGGELVGLPKGVAGNSEVGHMNLGAGRSVRQDLVRINEAIENKTLAQMPELKNLISYAKSHSNKIHLMGLLSDGGVHSHIAHLKEIISILSDIATKDGFFVKVRILPARSFDVEANVLDSTQLFRDTGWSSKVNLKNGIFKMWEDAKNKNV